MTKCMVMMMEGEEGLTQMLVFFSVDPKLVGMANLRNLNRSQVLCCVIPTW